MKRLLQTVGLAAAGVALVVVPSTSAQAVTKHAWTTYQGAGDIVGVHAEGNWWKGSDGRFYLDGFVKDSKADGYGAELKIRAQYKNGDVRDEVEWVTSGYGDKEPIGNDQIGYYSFASNLDMLLVTECLLTRNSAGKIIEKPGSCAKWYENILA